MEIKKKKEIRRPGVGGGGTGGVDSRDSAPISPKHPTDPKTPNSPDAPRPFLANVDKHRQRFHGGKLFLRELTYAIQLDQAEDKLVLPRLRLEVRDDLPTWVPPRRRRRPRRSPIPNLSRKKYLHSVQLKQWMKRIIEILAGERQHMRVLLVQDPEAAPLEWEGQCETCGATFSVRGIWSDRDRLPDLGGTAFLDNCGAPDRAILERVIIPRKSPQRRNWLRIKRIAPRR